MTIETKYKTGQDLFFIAEGDVLKMPVWRITTETKVGGTVVMYHFDKRIQGNPVNYDRYECEVSDTAEGLIKYFTERLR